ncbi:hypothetical protein BN2537_15895 [Streptomyces venezuelae]|nr:hypothetical protein BN2537_15895 [Streptomyces venezuelae]
MAGILIRAASDAGSGRGPERSPAAPATGPASRGAACAVPGGREASPSGACESRTTPTRAAQASAPTEGTRLDGALPGFGPEPCFMRIVPLLNGVPDLAEPEPEPEPWA